MPGTILYVHRLALDHRRGRIVFGNLMAPCALGRGGTVVRKREGDGGTPRATMRPLAVWWRADRGGRPRTILPARRIRADDGWCDDARHPRYNRAVRLPFAGGHERMCRDDHLYDVVIALDWNTRPAIRGRGSAIFLHIARPGYAPTEGCIAISPHTMRLILPRLGPATRIVVRGH